MPSVSARRLALCLSFLAASSCAGFAKSASAVATTAYLVSLPDVSSPDNQIAIRVNASPLSYSVTFHGEPVVVDSPLGLDLKGITSSGKFTVLDAQRRVEDKTTTPVWGKTATIRNHYNELTLSLEGSDAAHTRLQLLVRAYDDGVALRYRLPGRANGDNSFVVTRERTSFRFVHDPTVWATTYPAFHHSSEQHYSRLKLSDLTTEGIVGLPLLAEVKPDLYAAIAEADLTDWAGMSLKYTNDGLTANLSPRLDGNGLVAGTLPHDSPWRVIMLGTTPGALIESSLIENLNPPSAIADTSWIHPGMMAWDHWWSGDVKMDTDTNKRYIAFASEM
jgi:alpha-glucosidase